MRTPRLPTARLAWRRRSVRPPRVRCSGRAEHKIISQRQQTTRPHGVGRWPCGAGDAAALDNDQIWRIRGPVYAPVGIPNGEAARKRCSGGECDCGVVTKNVAQFGIHSHRHNLRVGSGARPHLHIAAAPHAVVQCAGQFDSCRQRGVCGGRGSGRRIDTYHRGCRSLLAGFTTPTCNQQAQRQRQEGQARGPVQCGAGAQRPDAGVKQVIHVRKSTRLRVSVSELVNALGRCGRDFTFSPRFGPRLSASQARALRRHGSTLKPQIEWVLWVRQTLKYRISPLPFAPRPPFCMGA